MTEIEEFRKWKATYNPTPPKPNKTYNKFFWWRRYQEHKFLPKPSDIFSKAKNGDFDVSPYWKQYQWEYWFEEQELTKFRTNYTGSYEDLDWHERQITKLYWERRKRLVKDAEKDDLNRWELLVKNLKTYYGGTEEQIKDMFENFHGTMIEFIEAYRNSKTVPKSSYIYTQQQL